MATVECALLENVFESACAVSGCSWYGGWSKNSRARQLNNIDADATEIDTIMGSPRSTKAHNNHFARRVPPVESTMLSVYLDNSHSSIQHNPQLT